jgi:hypothetical protein
MADTIRRRLIAPIAAVDFEETCYFTHSVLLS